MSARLRQLLLVPLTLFAMTPGLAWLTSGEILACGAKECAYDQGCYSQGACHHGQRCSMDGNDPVWVDDESCPGGGGG